MNYFNAQRTQLVVWEVLEVEGNQRLATSDNGCRQNMSVVRVRKIQTSTRGFPPCHHRVPEGSSHGINALMDSAGIEIRMNSLHCLGDLPKNSLRPERSVKPLFSESKKGVAQGAGH